MSNFKRSHVLKIHYHYAAFFGELYAQNSSPDYGTTKAGSFYNHDGVKIYYEIYGQGKPLVVLHGNGGSIRVAPI
jgi:hypothetical protein